MLDNSSLVWCFRPFVENVRCSRSLDLVFLVGGEKLWNSFCYFTVDVSFCLLADLWIMEWRGRWSGCQMRHKASIFLGGHKSHWRHVDRKMCRAPRINIWFYWFLPCLRICTEGCLQSQCTGTRCQFVNEGNRPIASLVPYCSLWVVLAPLGLLRCPKVRLNQPW